MSLLPSLRPMVIAGPYDAPHTLEFFVDYVCPFSAKMAKTIDTVVKPLLEDNGTYASKVKAIIRLQVQPWHGSSTFTHEAGVAVARAAPDSFWAYSLELFENQKEYFDIPVSNFTPTQIRHSLAELGTSIYGNAKVAEIKELLTLSSTPNGGTAVTEDLKYTIKFSRQNGIHVTPTVLWDGIIASEISSSWGEYEWKKFLAEKVKI